MKTKSFLITVLLSTLHTPCNSQSSDFLTDGKVWNCVEKMYDEHYGLSEIPYTVTVCADTIYCGFPCKRMEKAFMDNREKPITFYAMEKDSRLYQIFGSDEIVEILNFDLSIGDQDGYTGHVSHIDTITVNGVERKRFTVERDRLFIKDYWTYYIVEGIGVSNNALRFEDVSSYYDELCSVYENGVCIFRASDFIPDKWKYPEPETKGFTISEDAISTDTMYLYNMGAKGYFTESNAHGTQACFGDTGLKVCFIKYIPKTIAGEDSVWDNETYELRVFSENNNTWGSASIENEYEMLIDHSTQGNNCQLFHIKNNGWYFRFYGSGDSRYSPPLYPLPYVGVGEYSDKSISEIINPLINIMDASIFKTFSAYHTDWAFVTKAAYEAQQKRLQTYQASQELLAALDKAETLGLDTTEEQAVYDDTNNGSEELTAATASLMDKIAFYYETVDLSQVKKEPHNKVVFTPQGVKTSTNSKGIRIIRYSDGTTKKVYTR